MPRAGGPLTVNGLRIEVLEGGEGRPILFLHPGIGIDAAAPVLDALAAKARLIAPSHPGFGTSELPKHDHRRRSLRISISICSTSSICATCWWSASASAAGSRPRSR